MELFEALTRMQSTHLQSQPLVTLLTELDFQISVSMSPVPSSAGTSLCILHLLGRGWSIRTVFGVGQYIKIVKEKIFRGLSPPN